MIQWGATQIGLFMPRSPDDQIAYMANNGTEITVGEAAGLRGAILWAPGTTAISLGSSKVIANVNGRVGIINNGASAYQRAGKIPGALY